MQAEMLLLSENESVNEYKKQFSGTESYDWMGDQWSPLPRVA